VALAFDASAFAPKLLQPLKTSEVIKTNKDADALVRYDREFL
jgi:hypothetical protein